MVVDNNGSRQCRDDGVEMIAAAAEDGGSGQQLWWQLTMVVDDDGGGWRGEGREGVARDGWDSGVANMATAADNNGNGGCWRQ
jgi:hypothetical protein